MSGCWLWDSGVNTKGYGQFYGNRENLLAHRVSYELHRGTIPAGLHVLHSCDTPSCVNPAHLKLGTNLDNIRDKVAKKRCRAIRGERAPWAKLTQAQVDHIKQKAMKGVEYCALYKVSPALISSIQRGHRWPG